MKTVFTLSEAKSKFSEIINRIIYKNEKIIITKKGRRVAVVLPIEDYARSEVSGLIEARGAPEDLDESIDEMIHRIYRARESETDREVSL